MRCVFLLFGEQGGKSCYGPAPYLTSSHHYRHLIDVLTRLESKDFFYGHLAFSRTVSRILTASNIYILHSLRDPRDVLLSQLAFALKHPQHFMHHHLKELHDPYEQQRLILQGYLPNGKVLQKSMADQYKDLEKWMSSSQMLLIRYEDLVGERGYGDPERQLSSVKKISCFLDLSMSHAQIKNISESLYDVNTPGFRNGKIGTWSSVLSHDFLDLFNSEMRSTMERWSYS